LELSWPTTTQKTNGSVTRPYFELQRTFDFQRWEPIGQRQRALTTTPGQLLSATLPYFGNYPLVTTSWQIDPVSGEGHFIATTNSIPLSTIRN